MLIDSVKGVEPQTIKLFEVCRMRGIPIVTFINKMDRDGKDPLELLDEIERVLGIPCSPVNWPIGYGQRVRRASTIAGGQRLLLFERAARRRTSACACTRADLDDPALRRSHRRRALAQGCARSSRCSTPPATPFDREQVPAPAS